MGVERLATPPASVLQLFRDVVRHARPECIAVLVGTAVACFAVYAVAHRALLASSDTYRSGSLHLRVEVLTRIVSSLHAAVITPVAIYATFFDDALASDAVLGAPAPINYAALMFAFSTGYFVADLVMVAWSALPPVAPIVLHHVLAGVGLGSACGPYMQMAYFALGLLCTEFTTVLNNLDWLGATFGYGHTAAIRILRVFYTISWLIFRIALFYFLWYKMWQFRSDALKAHIFFQVIIIANMCWLQFMNHVYFVIGPFRGYLADVGITIFGGEKQPTVQTVNTDQKQRKKSN